jgi:hypothetical protein
VREAFSFHLWCAGRCVEIKKKDHRRRILINGGMEPWFKAMLTPEARCEQLFKFCQKRFLFCRDVKIFLAGTSTHMQKGGGGVNVEIVYDYSCASCALQLFCAAVQ